VITDTEQHVDALTAMLYPAYTKRCEHCGGYVVTTPEEAMRRYTEAAYEPLVKLAETLQDPSAAVTGLPTMGTYGTMLGGAVSRTRGHHAYRKHPHRRRDCDCHDHYDRCRCCGHDDCHCRCCVVDADLVVHARLGERRVVPITIENNRRREREIRLELSDFSSRRGSQTNVRGRLATPAEFTLAACEEREAVVVIDIDSRDDKGDEPDRPEEGRLPDVDDCVVAYADLRVVGCDTRPIRIAVAVLPRDCHSYPVDCASAYCC
jgi:hypothetical protein